jgi:tRNA(Leu) C34 or U34 (ribose-2'-O)-methylase TrmL
MSAATVQQQRPVDTWDAEAMRKLVEPMLYVSKDEEINRLAVADMLHELQVVEMEEWERTMRKRKQSVIMKEMMLKSNVTM